MQIVEKRKAVVVVVVVLVGTATHQSGERAQHKRRSGHSGGRAHVCIVCTAANRKRTRARRAGVPHKI